MKYFSFLYMPSVIKLCKVLLTFYVEFYVLINYVIITVLVSIYLCRIEVVQRLSNTNAHMENIQRYAKCLNV